MLPVVPRNCILESTTRRLLQLPRAPNGRETSEGEIGVYRYREVKADGTDLFALEWLLPETGYDVHVSKLRV